MSAIAADPYTRGAAYGPLRFLHRLNPVGKIAATLPAMVFVIFARGVATPLLFVVFALAVLLVGARLRGRLLAGVLVGLPVMVAVLSISFGLWTDASLVDTSAVLVQIGGFQYHRDAWLTGLATALRLASLVLLAMLAGTTTPGPDLVRSLVQQLRLPYRIGYTALAALRFVPRLGHELRVIQSAHRVRGMAGGRGPLAELRRRLGYAIPLLVSAIRHAERVALAMDARGFGAHPTRTERHVVPFRLRDWLFIVVCWAVTAAIPLLADAIA